MQRDGSPAAHDETPQAELDSEQLACNLRAAGRQSACILPLFCLLGLSSLGPLVVGCNHTGHTTGIEHDKVLPGTLVRAGHPQMSNLPSIDASLFRHQNKAFWERPIRPSWHPDLAPE